MRWAAVVLLSACTQAAPAGVEDLSSILETDLGGLVAQPDLVSGSSADLAEQPSGPTRYPHDTLASPVTAAVAATLRAIAARGTHRSDVFMKVGASGTVSTNLLYCFSGLAQYTVDLDGRDALQPTIDTFRMG